MRTTEQSMDREVKSTTKVLILGSSVSGGTASREYQAVKAYRSTWTVDVVTPTQWKAMTADQFMAYRAIIIGDQAGTTGCVGNEAPFQAAIETKDTWGAVIDGRVSIFSTNPVSNGTAQVVQNGIRFVMDTPAPYTGIYVSLGCAYQNAPADTQVSLLDELGTFKVQGVPGCGASGHFFTMSSATLNSGISDSNLPGSGGCVAKSVFTSYPDHTYSFVTLDVTSATKPVPGAQPIVDYNGTAGPGVTYVGTPYWLVRGASNSDSGCGQDGVPSSETCDLGDGINGIPAAQGQDPLSTCSWSCHLNWCGDGHLDPEFGEECDLGNKNGRVNDVTGNLSTCNGLCKLVQLPQANLPPVMHCKDVTVQATNTCGVMADINDNSTDPEEQPLTCVQNPPGPYNLGAGASSSVLVALTCTDSANNSAGCTGTVTVVDKVAPEVTLIPTSNPNQSLECGGTYTDPGASASDLCSGPLPASAIAVSGSVNMSVPATYSLTYTATDPANNVSAPKTRNVVVSDTQAPSLFIGLANVGQECGLPFTDPGYSATDACLGDVTSRVVRTGSVDTATLGNYVLKYNVADTVGNAAPEQSRVVTVADTLVPTVNMNPPASVTAECGQPDFLDPGATASDTCAGALAATAVNPPNIGATGTYNVQYHAFDPTGNEGFSSGTRTVTVNDTLAPAVTLNGDASMGLECAAVFNDPGATANDQCVGPLSVTVSGAVDNKQLNTPQTLVYSANDGKGHVGSVSRSVTVTDTLKPTVTVNGGLSQSVECGDPAYADPGATGNDACAGVLPATAVTSANPGVPGSYTINYEAVDPSGNKGTSAAGRQVTVSDTLPPALTLLGEAAPKLECGTPFSDPGATANDQCAGDLNVSKTGSVNHQVPGPYTLSYSANDGQGHTVSADRTVTVRDTLAPQVAITGPLADTAECGNGAYADPGATASDACAGPLPAVAENPPDTGVPGPYAVRYKATDPAGNTGYSAGTRSVTVSDTLAPTLTLLGSTPQGLECGTPWADPGATASDLCAGNLDLLINKSGGVNHMVPAPYTVTYSVNDGHGHTDSKDRTVNVSDTKKPVITVSGPLDTTFECGSGPYQDPGGTASDVCAGALPVTTVVSGDPTRPGDLIVSFWAQDPSGNREDSAVKRTVHVNDTVAPEVTLTGSASMGLECADPFLDPGATASDKCAGPLSVTVGGAVNNKLLNTPQTLTYSADDGHGQTGSVSRTVTVTDSKKPVVTVVGPLTRSVECGDPTYADPGATADDACAGPLTAVATTSANPGAPGSYTINYEATDPSGNKGTSSTGRTVTVSDTLAPTLTLHGDAVMPLECATAFNDPGAEASDQCAGDLSGAIQKSGSVDNMQPAAYPLTYSVSDGQSHTASKVRTVNVSDTLKPVITVLGPLDATYECGSTYVDQGATASDTCAGPLPVTTVQTSNPNQPGQFIVSYWAQDPSGNREDSAVTRTVHVNDTEPPTLLLEGSANMGLECAAAFEDPGATASDVCAGPLPVTVNGAVNNKLLNTPQTLTYSANDGNGQTSSVSRTVTVSDKTAPIITVNGPLEQTVSCGSGPYADPGATATDACAGDLTAAITTSGSVNPGAAGSYSLTYKVKDPSNNEAVSSDVRSVQVVDDLPPALTLLPPLNPSVECGTAFNDPGATANDACAGDLTAAIVKTGSVTTGTPGSYQLDYSVTDPSNHSVSKSRTVAVADTQAPVLALIGANPLNVECAPTYVDPGATATDLCEGNLDSRVSHNMADSTQPGDYTVTYTASDLTGHAATPIDRAVAVRDTKKPVITVLGPLETSYECGSGQYQDPGATASDVCAGSLPVTTVQAGDPTRPGDMIISFWAQDPSGNREDSAVKRTVHVNDTGKPALALLGAAVQTLECGTAFVDPGATANDACFGDLTSAITTSGAVNSGVPADYNLIYNVTDGANSADSVSRKVEVRDTKDPVITVLGPLTTTYECGGTYSDPGATATDACAGNLTAAIVATQTPDPNAPANFTVSYSVTDPSGHTATSAVARTVTMNDNLAPTIALVGPASQVLECSQSQYDDPGATANDQCIGPVPVQRTGTVNMQVSGTYKLDYSAKDTAGNTSPTVTRNVTITDTMGPAIALTGPNAIYLECKVGTYEELGATANDICSGPVAVTIDASEVNTDQLGPYLVHYSATDLSGNTNTTVRNVLVEDNLPPTIALKNPNPMVMECATPYVDPGATASDVCQGNVSDTVFIEFNGVKTMEEGNYIVRYQADDRRGHTVQATRNVKVEDHTAPVLTVMGDATSEVQCGTSPDLGGVQATDSCYGDLTASIIRSPAQLPSTPGEYDVTYSVTDPAGNSALNSVTRHFTVVDSGTPTLVVNGVTAPYELHYECTGHAVGNVWSNPGASATDLCEGNLQVHQYNSGDDDGDGIPGCDPETPVYPCDPDDFGPGPTTETEGLYYVQYLAWDDTFNIQGVILSVYVQDTLKPVLAINGPESVQTQCFKPTDDPTDPDDVPEVDPNPYIDEGATGDDQCYGDVTPSVMTFGEVNKQAVGTYNIEYQVRDGAYNWADPVIRAVEVFDNISPKLKDNGPLAISPPDNTLRTVELSECTLAWDLCDGYMDINARAYDLVVTSNDPNQDPGDIAIIDNSTFQIRSRNNTDGTPRTYTAAFKVADNSGNVQQAGTCTLNVTSGPLAGR